MSRNKLNIDLFWYSIGVILPMATLFIRSPIYTRIYSPEAYGAYTITYVTYTYLSSIFFNWITSCSWRYYLKYDKKNDLGTYTRVIKRLYSFSIFILFVISTVWFLFTKDSFQRTLIIYGFAFATSQELLNTMYVKLRMRNKSKSYNLQIGSKALVSFAFLLLLTFKYSMGIEAFFIAPLAFNIVFLLQFTRTKKQETPKYHSVNSHTRRFIKYGLSTLVFTTGLFLLVSSDRYIILFFWGKEKVGIYNQTYNLAQMGIATVFAIFNAAFNPRLIPSLENKPNNSNKLLVNYLYMALYISTPLLVLLCLYSKDINYILLGKDFREAWQIMPFVFCSIFLFNLTHFATLKLKFQNKIKLLIIATLCASVINIILNFIFIPTYGYEFASYTTLFAYIILFVLLYALAKIFSKESKNNLINIFIVLAITILFIPIKILTTQLDLNVYIEATVVSIVSLGIFAMTTYRISPFKMNLNG